MRFAWVASAAVHAGAIACLAFASIRDEAARPHPRAEPIAVPVQPAVAWIDVALLDDPVRAKPAIGRGGGVAIAASGRSHGAVPSGEAPAASPVTSSALPPTSLFRMRAVDLRAPADVLRSEVAYSPPQPEPSSRLHWHKDGDAVLDDRVTAMRVDPDGVAHFEDKADVRIDVPLPSLDTLRHLPQALKAVPGDVHDALRGWYQDVQVQNEFLAHYDRTKHLDEIPNGCADYAELGCIDPDVPPAKHRIDLDALISGTGDISALLERKLVGDPYASRKRQLLEDTFAERAAHGEAYRAAQLLRSADTMQRNLEWLWATTHDAAARRAATFELWDDCAEGDGPLGEAGQRARELVMVWIREKLPAASADAYARAELDALAQRRRSVQAFEPYR
jgi:hypothetical protein